MPYFWLSFCDGARPKGAQFLGVAIVDAPSFHTVHLVARDAGCNPGGEVSIEEIPPEEEFIFAPHLNRLMGDAELLERGFTDPPGVHPEPDPIAVAALAAGKRDAMMVEEIHGLLNIAHRTKDENVRNWALARIDMLCEPNI